jgi:hypothetical protein
MDEIPDKSSKKVVAKKLPDKQPHKMMDKKGKFDADKPKVDQIVHRSVASDFKTKPVFKRPFNYFMSWDKIEFLRHFGFVKQVNQIPPRPLDELCQAQNKQETLLNYWVDHISKWVLLSDHIFFATSVSTPSAAAFALVTRYQKEQGNHSQRTAYVSTFCSSLRKDPDGGKWGSKNFMFRVLASLKRLGYGEVMLLPVNTPSVLLFYAKCGFRQTPRSKYMHAELKDFHDPARLDLANTIEEAMANLNRLEQQSDLISNYKESADQRPQLIAQLDAQIPAAKGPGAVKGSSDSAANALNLVITSFQERFPDVEQVQTVQRAWIFTYDQLPSPESLMTRQYEQQGIQLHKIRPNEIFWDVCPGKDRILLGAVIFNADDERSIYVYLYKNAERQAVTVKLKPKTFMLLTMYKSNVKSKKSKRSTNAYRVRRSTKGDAASSKAQAAAGGVKVEHSGQEKIVEYCISCAMPSTPVVEHAGDES